jgi:arylsulfatase A-like enzyme/Flp pilus assembly protein TadD
MTARRRDARLLLAAAIALVAACSRQSERPVRETFRGAPVIVISIDTLRADRLPAWGYDGVKTPNIDRLRNDGILYRNAYSHVPLTLPSHASLFTGLLPADHGVRDNIGYPLAGTRATLPRALREHGYATGAAVSSYVLRGTTGMGALFDWYDDPLAFTPGTQLGAIQRAGGATAASAQAWIARQGASPFFLFLHLFEPHTPYDAPEPFRSAASHPYDGEIAYVDSIVGSFLDDLQRRGIYDRAVVILLSDHGEGLGDHGETEHGIFVYREAIHVPLIVKLPKNANAGTAVDSPVGLVDVFPTVLSLVGVDPPASLAGVALLGPAAKPLQPRRIFSESLYPRLHLGWSDVRSLIDDTRHYIDAPRPELYVHREDRREERNVLESERRAAASFREELRRFEKNLTAPAAASPEEVAKLAALGYLSAPASMTGELPDAKDRIHQFAAYTAAREAFARGEVEAAIAGFRAVLAENPNFTDAALELADVYEKVRRFDEAAELYRGVLARHPSLREQAAIGVATASLGAGKLDDARKHAELALSSNPAAAHMVLGRIALAAKQPAAAENHARSAARDPRYEPQAVLLLSEALLARGGPQSAEASLRVLDQLNGARIRKGEQALPSVEIARASVLMRLSRPAEAAAALRAAIQMQPDAVEAYGRLAAIHLLQNDLAAAEGVLTQMVNVKPSPARARMAAETLAHFGHAEAAERWRRRSREIAGVR